MQFTVLSVLCLLATMSIATGVPGAPFETDIKDEHVQTMKKFALDQFAAGGGDPAVGLGELVSAKKQVVAGTLTTLVFKQADGSKCEIVIWDQPWTKKREVTRSTCVHIAATSQ